MIKALIFDWGDTVMRDYGLDGSMWKWEKYDWISGAEDALKILSDKYPCIIATSAEHSFTEDMIKALELVGADKYFMHFFSSNDLGFRKPDIRFYQQILRKLNLKANEVVMIGNHYIKDIEAAKNAGLETVFFNEKNENGNFSAADYQIQNMNQLTETIKKYEV